MKLTTALYTAAFVLAPAVGFAADQSATSASDRSYPYPDWPAIAKTAPQKSTEQQKPAEQTEPQKNTDQHPAEQSGSSGYEPSLLEKAARALEALRALVVNCGKLVSTRTIWVKGKTIASIFAPRAARIGFPVPRL